MSQYATTSDLSDLGLPGPWLSGVSTAIQTKHLQVASGKMDSKIGRAYSLPLTSWGDDLVGCCVCIASYMLMGRHGFNPDNGANQIIVKNYDDCMAWLEDVATGKAKLQDVADATPEEDELEPGVTTETAGDWLDMGSVSDGG